VRWSVSAEEVEKNAVIVCVLIQEEVNEAQTAYHLFLAGFLPTKMIKLKRGRIAFGIHQLLYAGGLLSYLENFPDSPEQHSFNTSVNTNIDKHHPLYLNLDPEKSGDEYFRNGDYAAAINKYNLALQKHTNDTEIYYKLGLVYYQLGDYQTAIINYNQVINMSPNYSKAYHQRGLAYYQLANYQIAIEDYTQAMRINPDIAVIYKHRADARYRIGDNQGAIEDYHQAIKINPHYAINHKNRENSPYLSDEKHQLIKEMAVKPDDAIGLKNRGNTLCELGEYERAIIDYNQAIKINANFTDAYYHRGNAHFDLGNYEAAIDDFRKVIKMKSNYTNAYYNCGQARLIIGDKQGAIDDFKKAADLYWQDGKLEEHKDTQAIILDLEIDESLDILNF
jgi:tetratricopeptide (TPR) repeat protein